MIKLTAGTTATGERLKSRSPGASVASTWEIVGSGFLYHPWLPTSS
jgi:hypothetical protein